MTPKWITGLVRARQFAEDNAKQELATAERLASRAHARVRYNADRLESLKYAGAEGTAATFVASAVALQAAAATHAAARQAAEQADHETQGRRSDLTNAAVSRRSAEELAERARAAERARQALIAQRATDEIAAAVFRRNHEQDGGSDEVTP
jgi:flagellar export protein FliJ